jgi:hypothetical protein
MAADMAVKARAMYCANEFHNTPCSRFASSDIKTKSSAHLRYKVSEGAERHPRQTIQRAGRLLQAFGADVRVPTGGVNRLMAQQGLDEHQVRTSIEQMSGKAMPQRVGRAALAF